MWWCDAGQVQISLIAEAVMWKRGILVMPPIVNQLVKAMQVSPALFAMSANVMLCQSSGAAWYAVPAVRGILWLLIEPHRAKLAQCFCKCLQTGSNSFDCIALTSLHTFFSDVNCTVAGIRLSACYPQKDLPKCHPCCIVLHAFK